MNPLIIGLVALGGYLWYEHHKKTSSPLVTDAASVATSKQILAAWLATQGALYVPAGSPTDPNEPGFKAMLSKFQIWANAGGIPGSNLRTDGVLDQATLISLQYEFQMGIQKGAASPGTVPHA